MTWTSFHSRGEVLRTVEDAVNARRDGILPMDIDGVAENFADELDLIAALILRWHARLSGNIERAIAAEPLDLTAAVVNAWRTTAAAAPGVRAVIDSCTAAPLDAAMATALQRAQQKEWARLANVAGLASDESAAALRAGQEVEAAARAGLVATQPITQPTTQPITQARPEPTNRERTSAGTDLSQSSRAPQVSFVDRIKAVIAA